LQNRSSSELDMGGSSDSDYTSGPPPFIVFSLTGYDVTLANLDNMVDILGKHFFLFALTYHDQGRDHFTGSLKLTSPYKAGWWCYDGFGIQRTLPRMVSSGSIPQCPPRSSISLAIYACCGTYIYSSC